MRGPKPKPDLALAFSLHSGPGTYALLLGSGVSSAAGVPTGWRVTLDLVRKLAAAEGENPADPEAWYRGRFGRGPNYSEVVDELAPTRDERRALLQGYFEPDARDREEGKKVPTEAHRAVARLCAGGHVRVVLTTNFDRLLERALEAEGVSPVVIDTSDAAEGAPPLQHARCTVIKVNGDYLDTRIKNTPDELAEYDGRMVELLGRVFDEYGLVVCGWSGTYDSALIDALKRAGGRRYMTYWVSRGAPSEAERDLTSFVRGTAIEAEGADQFFASLLDKVEALETFGGEDPLSAPVAVATAKRHLDEPGRRVRLWELVSSLGREAREGLFGDERFALDWFPEAADRESEMAGFAAEMKKRVFSYERTCEAAAGVAAAGGRYADERQAGAFRELVELISNPPRTDGPFVEVWDRLEIYPGLFVLYAGGVAATGAGNWPFLKAVLRDSMFTDIRGTVPLVLKVYPWEVDRRKEITNAALFPGQNLYEPIAERLYRTLRGPLEEYLPLKARYDAAFHRFEALAALTHVDVQKERDGDEDWVPLGRFAVLDRTRYGRNSLGEDSEYAALRSEYGEEGSGWGPVRHGLLKQRASSDGRGIPSEETVEHNFGVVDAMIRRASRRL